jgi:hypothetical protein
MAHPHANPSRRTDARSATHGRRRAARPVSSADRCRRKFLRYFPDGFRDADYLDLERGYKWTTHERWQQVLDRDAMDRLLRGGEFAEIAARAVRVEQQSRHPMIFSFEKMALRDAVRSAQGARAFSQGLHAFLHDDGVDEAVRFERWVETIAALPRRQTRVLTWPLVTVFGFIAQPTRHIFLKPVVTRAAAKAYGFDFEYRSRPNWATYRCLLEFAATVRRDQRDLGPRDMIDLQSFIWVQGSAEY